ncbi:MAG: mannose-6-phosphate isomerase-like protein (cupin superfamily) [Alteromonadaceae bacterium]|jgi:mannose-6-phosphate isomerase-like protein (cupin superfamily)
MSKVVSSQSVSPQSISPKSIAESLTDLWSPKIVGEVDNHYVKVAKVQGTFGWHSHADEDELFFVLKGQLCIELDTESVTLNEGDMYIVPKGVKHNPVADNECQILLFEKKTTLHTGGVKTDKTRSIEDQLG